MSEPMTTEERVEALSEVLGEHFWDMSDEVKVDGVWTWVVCCECGDQPPMEDGHKHIAAAILASPAFRAIVAGERDQERADWSSWLDGWLGAVGPKPPTVEVVAHALRVGPRPFGAAATKRETP